MNTPLIPRGKMYLPMHITANWLITAEEYERLQTNSRCEYPDDRWQIHTAEGTTHFYRSWTGKEVYNFTPEERGDGYAIDEFKFVRTLGQLWLSRAHQETHRTILLTIMDSALDIHPASSDVYL